MMSFALSARKPGTDDSSTLETAIKTSIFAQIFRDDQVEAETERRLDIIRANTPIRTGRLRAGWRVKQRDAVANPEADIFTFAEFENPVPYAERRLKDFDFAAILEDAL